MKRSEINAVMREADASLRQRRFHLPPFAYWAPEDRAAKGEEVREIVDRRLGWDITDFGQGDSRRVGLSLFTLRNGSVENLKTGRGKLHAEKIMIVDVDQVTPCTSIGPRPKTSSTGAVANWQSSCTTRLTMRGWQPPKCPSAWMESDASSKPVTRWC